IAEIVSAHGGNWLESRMAHLAGQFAGILRVEVAEEQAESLTKALKNLAASGLESVVLTDPTQAPNIDAPRVLLDLVGQDRPGIVREITRVLAACGVNVEELETEQQHAPNTGQALFHAQASLRLPPGLTEQALREALEAVAGDLMVDVSLASAG
ncbi:MAG: hypothetical protein KDA37_05990, partial [Planctomycetales bacterium]|nr:hypothetical protein [Planctomycetales bacterium]